MTHSSRNLDIARDRLCIGSKQNIAQRLLWSPSVMNRNVKSTGCSGFKNVSCILLTLPLLSSKSEKRKEPVSFHILVQRLLFMLRDKKSFGVKPLRQGNQLGTPCFTESAYLISRMSPTYNAGKAWHHIFKIHLNLQKLFESTFPRLNWV